jgi:NAD+---dinitrogen-reductase ADP-D-ribosyltransferase
VNAERPLANLCNLPPWEIASRDFNRKPQSLHIHGVLGMHRHLFRRLDRLGTWDERAKIYEEYMQEAFYLHQWSRESDPGGHLSLKNSYLRFLRGWLFDSNGVEAAVLKGWVESRFGIVPIYHQGRIHGKDSQAYQSYLAGRMRASACTNAIFAQLDLLYEFVQYELHRRDCARSHLTLYRGVYNFAEHDILEQPDERHAVVRLNNLNSFTRNFERAWEFGTIVMETRVPVPKIFFDGSFLHAGILQGEEEVLVIGGEYEITLRLY